MPPLAQGGQPDRVRVGAARDRHERFHEPQPLEGVLGVAHRAGEGGRQVVLDERPREGRAAQEDGPTLVQAARDELGEVLLHHDRRLHEQARTCR